LHPVRTRVLLVLFATLCFPAGSPAVAVELALPPLNERLPVLPPEIRAAPEKPVVEAPDARGLLESCKEPVFTDCFRLWRPPVPDPPAPPGSAKGPGGGKGGDTPPGSAPPGGDPPPPPPPYVPPPPRPDLDEADYNALLKAMKEAGVDQKSVVVTPPKDGSSVITLEPKQKPRQTKP
jgi:hypothetical protein